MKALSLIVSLAVFTAAGYFFARDFTYTLEMNYIIYMSLLIILMLICIVGVLINIPMILMEKRKMKLFVYNKYSRKSLKDKKFQINFETS